MLDQRPWWQQAPETTRRGREEPSRLQSVQAAEPLALTSRRGQVQASSLYALPAPGLIGPEDRDLCPSMRASPGEMLKVTRVLTARLARLGAAWGLAWKR